CKSIVTPEGLKNNLQNTRGVLSLRPKLLPLFRAVSDRNETMPYYTTKRKEGQDLLVSQLFKSQP
ncbi:MAG: hypothetical protein AB1797_07900, partial [bacterium]